jgi:hypothetical protein
MLGESNIDALPGESNGKILCWGLAIKKSMLGESNGKIFTLGESNKKICAG